MAAEDTQSAQEQPQPTEGASETQNAAPAPTPALNREQRRAQAKGKKISPTGTNPALGQFNNRSNSNSRSGGASVEKRLPRTGHK